MRSVFEDMQAGVDHFVDRPRETVSGPAAFRASPIMSQSPQSAAARNERHKFVQSMRQRMRPGQPSFVPLSPAQRPSSASRPSTARRPANASMEARLGAADFFKPGAQTYRNTKRRPATAKATLDGSRGQNTFGPQPSRSTSLRWSSTPSSSAKLPTSVPGSALNSPKRSLSGSSLRMSGGSLDASIYAALAADADASNAQYSRPGTASASNSGTAFPNRSRPGTAKSRSKGPAGDGMSRFQHPEPWNKLAPRGLPQYNCFSDRHMKGFWLSRDVEQAMIQSGASAPDWLVTSHHGDLKSSVQAELEAMSPPRAIRTGIKKMLSQTEHNSEDNQDDDLSESIQFRDIQNDQDGALEIDIEEDVALSSKVIPLFWDTRSLYARLSWRVADGEEAAADLDLAALLYDVDGFCVDICSWRNMQAGSGAVVHTGDWAPDYSEDADPVENSTGLEEMWIKMPLLPPNVSAVGFVVTRADGKSLGGCEGAELVITDSANRQRQNSFSVDDDLSSDLPGTVLARFRFKHRGASACTTCCVTRSSTGWQLLPCPSIANAVNVMEMVGVGEAMLVSVGSARRPSIVIEACTAPRPSLSLRGDRGQFTDMARALLEALQSACPRAHVVVNPPGTTPRLGAMEVALLFSGATKQASKPPVVLFSKIQSGKWPIPSIVAEEATLALESQRPAAPSVDMRSELVISVADDDEEPIPGCMLHVRPGGSEHDGYRVRTDAHGSIKTKLPPNVYSVAASYPGYTSTRPKLVKLKAMSKQPQRCSIRLARVDDNNG